MDLNDRSTKVLLVIVVVFVGLLVVGAVYFGAQSGSTTPISTTVDASKVKTDNEPFIGQANAPVTIVEWSDYQCPACKQFELTALPQVMSSYIDTGKVKLVFKDMAFLGKDSITGGEYGRAVWKLYPDKYFTWRTAMYNAQDQEGDQGFGNAATIDTLDATISGIDAAAVAADVKANASTYDAMLTADKTEGQGLNVQSTPSFIIGTKLIAGSYPFDTFKAAIDPLVK
ncbi:MAG: hypothetical protein RLZZ26_35 [Candidatus Parcubacteria bacterium]|jgi:protein-disulfide isomerase